MAKAKKKTPDTKDDPEYRRSIPGQYETITGRDWYTLEQLIAAGDPSATLIFVVDHMEKALIESIERNTDRILEKLENIWGQAADLNAAVGSKLPRRPRQPRASEMR